MRVAVPPILEENISATKTGIGLTSRTEQIDIVTGTTNKTVVTLSRKAEATAVTMLRVIIILTGSPPVE